jgi:hypothetical protein
MNSDSRELRQIVQMGPREQYQPKPRQSQTRAARLASTASIPEARFFSSRIFK